MKLPLSKLLPRRRWQRWALGFVLVLGAGWLAMSWLLAPYVRGKLQAMVADKLDAELRVGRLTYLPPFGVRVRDARIVAKEEGTGNRVEVLKFARLDLRLAKLPFGEGPLVIERIAVQEPELHLVMTEDGITGTHPGPPGEDDGPRELPKLPPGTRLSHMFELRHLSMWGGRVVLEDRTRPGSVPMVWSDLSVISDTTPLSKSAYTFRFTADHKEVAALSATGSLDLDALHVKVDSAKLAVAVDSGQLTSTMPAPLQDLIRTHKLKGKLGIDATADLPLQNLAAGTFDAKVDVSGASAYFPQTDSALDDVTLVFRCKTARASRPATAASTAPATTPATTKPSTPPLATPIHVILEQFTIASGPARFTVKSPGDGAPLIVVDAAANRWTLNELAGGFDFGPVKRSNSPAVDQGGLLDKFDLAGQLTFAARAEGQLKPPEGRPLSEWLDYEAVFRPIGLRVRPPKTPLALEDVRGGSVEVRPGVVSLENLRGHYGGDPITLRSARIPIPDDLSDMKDAFAIEEIDATIHFNRPNRPYPGGFGKVVDRLRPAGPFAIGGGSFFRVNRVPPADDGTPPEQPPKAPHRGDWFFGVSSDAGSFLLTDKLIPLDDIRGDATISNMLVNVTRLECSVLGGRGAASGKIMPRKPYAVADGRVALRDVDLATLARVLEPDDPNSKLVGRGFVNFVFEGNIATDKEEGVKPAESLRGRGEFEVIEGHFWTLPILGRVASETKQGDALTLGEAAGVFRIADERVVFDNAAVSSPALGLVGSGSVGFDKSLDLRITAAPLGDMRDHVKRSRIPIFSDVAGEVVGGIQKLLGAATRTLLYEFRVTGSASDPNFQAVPAPILSDPAALLFGRMLDDRRKDRLIDAVKSAPAGK